MNQLILEKRYPFHKEYGAVQTVDENGEQKVKITFLAEIERASHFKYNIKKNNILINDKAPDLVIEKLSAKIGSLFSPLEVETSENGNLKQICNLKDIVNSWKSLKPKLSEYYQGEKMKRLMSSTENELGSKNTIQNRILNSFFYRLYFLPFRDYLNEEDKDFDLYLPIFPFKNKVRYSIAAAEPELTETGNLKLKLSGKCTDVRSFVQIINNKTATEVQESTCSGEIDFEYEFNRADGSIFSVNAEIFFQDEEKNTRKINFKLNPISTK
ncbi:hypothetical protein SAMN05421664_0868 [Chryseobacterium soldanellicola]|uniref:Uncharacterized protein n=1 Tax=Chryseobacterium soldanellicola TaxID=311333 RepID=A0A1H0YQS0_9FLAO|nr:hypothetical protein [Chryseobacterium soldanellicola]SDQ17186.1 hypothetical protein SAMN05421664_0868 [Chryseobacterium soldanellicola]